MLFIIPFSSFPANRTIDKLGAGYSIKLGCFLTLLGAWSRIFVNFNFNTTIIGSILAGIGAPFIYNANGRIGVSWFDPRNIVRVTTIITLMGTVNGIIGLIIPSIIFRGYDITNISGGV